MVMCSTPQKQSGWMPGDGELIKGGRSDGGDVEDIWQVWRDEGVDGLEIVGF